MKRRTFAVLALMALGTLWGASAPSEITVKLVMMESEYVLGERIRAIVDIANGSADTIDARTDASPDRVRLELYRASDRSQYEKSSKGPFLAPVALLSGEGQKLEAFFGDHFTILDTTRYLARAVLIHDGVRYESALKSFTVVPGLNCGGALQMFAGRDDLKREFELVHWGRNREEHLFLKVEDKGREPRRWQTTDLGAFLRVTRPKISVLPSGQVVTLQRYTQDSFIRSEFWSLPGVFEFHEHEQMFDPDVVGSERMKELYKEAGSVEPVRKAWWKFW